MREAVDSQIDPQGEASASPAVMQGQIRAFFAFDIGYEVSLGKVGQLLASNPKQPLSRKKQTPNYMQYRQVPQVFSLGQSQVGTLNGAPWPVEIEATIFDFGAVSLAYTWEFPAGGQVLSLTDLPTLSQQLAEWELEQHAKTQVKELMQRIQAAITRPELSVLVEDYYVFILERFSQPLSARDLLARHGVALAQALQFDTEPLSESQRFAALSNAISYYERDLVLIDWNAAIIYDMDYADTLKVLELLNVELLEARYMDAQLDSKVKNYERLNLAQPTWFMPLAIPYRQTINELAELRIESAVLAERVDNALKLIGDLYLARIYSAASEQFHMPAWDASISRKLDIIGNLYEMLTDRVHSAQGQTLELIIILLILMEIGLSLVRG